ncbi:MAG: GNAT family N-acetyltransferase [Rhodospirillaceae bacterium]|nr:GNAT family N-acetyltransferase [Rhodospirillaceae bacterium]
MNADSKTTIVKAVSPGDIDAVKSLFLAHEKELAEAACFHDFDAEMKNIRNIYAAPAGALLLALNNGEVVGVVGMVSANDKNDKNNKTAEMKRLYVKPEWRGRGVGRMLCEEILKAAKKQLYKTIRLETLFRLEAAISLYLEYGFKIEDENKAKRDKNICVMLASL